MRQLTGEKFWEVDTSARSAAAEGRGEQVKVKALALSLHPRFDAARTPVAAHGAAVDGSGCCVAVGGGKRLRDGAVLRPSRLWSSVAAAVRAAGPPSAGGPGHAAQARRAVAARAGHVALCRGRTGAAGGGPLSQLCGAFGLSHLERGGRRRPGACRGAPLLSAGGLRHLSWLFPQDGRATRSCSVGGGIRRTPLPGGRLLHLGLVR